MPPEHAQTEQKANKPVYVVAPKAPHVYTLILLHGLGSNGEKFGKELLETGITSEGHKLTDLLPGARFVFPTSRRRRSTAFRRSTLTQWFDIARLQEPSHRKELQLQGLCESAQEIMDILTKELEQVPAENIILGGLSQGCAMSIAILLCLEHPIGGYIGMCGYLTYQSELELAVADEDQTDDPFSRPDDACDEDKPRDRAVEAQTFERDLLGLAALDRSRVDRTAVATPVFLGHGSEDDKVPLPLGMAMAAVLRASEYQVDWKSHEGQGHWYKIPDEIDDIVEFIRSKVGWVFDMPTNGSG